MDPVKAFHFGVATSNSVLLGSSSGATPWIPVFGTVLHRTRAPCITLLGRHSKSESVAISEGVVSIVCSRWPWISWISWICDFIATQRLYVWAEKGMRHWSGPGSALVLLRGTALCCSFWYPRGSGSISTSYEKHMTCTAQWCLSNQRLFKLVRKTHLQCTS